MAARRPQPRMLNEVMDAIANLKEPKGSTMRRILNQMETNYVFNKKPSKVSPQPIMKALRHGVEMGLLRRNKGKFKLGLDPKDYAVYKTFQKKLKARETCGKNRRKRCRQRKRRNSKSRKRRNPLQFVEEPSDDEKIPSTRESDSTNPEDKAKRRKRKRSKKRSRKPRKGRRKGKGRRRSYTSETTEDSTKDHSPKSSRNSSHSESDHEDNDDQRKEPENPPEAERQYHPNCGNPECLCNVNQEEHIMEEDN